MEVLLIGKNLGQILSKSGQSSTGYTTIPRNYLFGAEGTNVNVWFRDVRRNGHSWTFEEEEELKQLYDELKDSEGNCYRSSENTEKHWH